MLRHRALIVAALADCIVAWTTPATLVAALKVLVLRPHATGPAAAN
eukprot:COSAG06_NODE_32298_length_508_cov_1.317848_2_plen_45_part_01